MRIDFSEPECSNCFHCRNFRSTLNTQESEPSNVIGSSVTSMPVSSGPVQALSHDSAASRSISTFRLGSQTPSAPPVITSVSSQPPQTLGLTSLRSDASGAPTVQATSGSAASATSTSSTSSPFQSFSPNSFGFAPAVTSVSSAPTQAFGQTTFGFGSSPNRFGFAVTSVSSAPTQAFGPNSFCFGASATSTSSTSSPVHSSSPFGFAPAVTSVSSAPTQAYGFNAFPVTTQHRIGSMQAPAQATSGFNVFAAPTQPRLGLGSMQAPAQATSGSGASGTSTSSSFLPFGCVPAPPTNGSSLFGPMQNSPWTTNSFSTGGSVDWVRSDVGVLPATSSSNLFGPNPSTSVSWLAKDYPRTGVNRFALPSSPTNLFGQNISTTGSNSGFPGFGVDYLPGSNSQPFGLNPYTTGGGSIFDGPKTSSPQPFGFNAATTPLPSSSFSSPATFSSNSLSGFGWSCHDGQCIRHRRYAPTPDGVTGGMYTSISASMSHQHKNHEELRWEDYKQGNKGSKTNAVFAYPQMASPSIFASPNVPDHPQRTTFGTTQESFTGPVSCFPQHNPAFTGSGTQFPNSSSSFFTTFPPINSSVQRPHETAAVSSPASGCTVCGATTSTSASGYSTFNGATLTPPSAATTSLPGLFYPMYGSVPMMFGTSPAAQVTTPVLQAYPVNGYILLPFAALNLQ